MRSFLQQRNTRRISAYRECPSDLKEHHGIEQTVLAGGYGYRQIMELVQNGADAIIEADDGNAASVNGNRIDVLLQPSYLYVANTGAPLSQEGIEALLSSHSSPKRGNQIGRFGLGFKSLLRLGGRIDLFTKTSGAIRFDPERCQDELKREFGVTEAPGLRLAWPLDEHERHDDVILNLLAWAETVVRVEVKTPDMFEHLHQEIHAFPAEFLLFFPVPTNLSLCDSEKPRREIKVEPQGPDQLLHDGHEVSRWRCTKRDVTITDDRAVADATHIHARNSVPLAWAIPLDGKRDEAGRFWAFFPTQTQTYLPGIVNAPWKLNSDRNAIIGGEWNTALMAEAAHLIAATLPSLSTDDDPARPIDAFPRQLARKDEDAAPLVEAVWQALENTSVIPDATGRLRQARDLQRHPRDNPKLVRDWQTLATSEDQAQFVHRSCLERQRASRLNSLADRLGALNDGKHQHPNLCRCEPRSWFETIASADKSKAFQVLHLAEAYANDCNPNVWGQVRPLLRIIPADNGRLLTAEQLVFAPEGTHVPDGRHPVARFLCEDEKAERILAHVMKVRRLDDKLWCEVLHHGLPYYHPGVERLNEPWRSFWALLRSAPETVRRPFITTNAHQIRVRRSDGKWLLFDKVLLPGMLVGRDDSSPNQNVLVDSGVHAKDESLLRTLGVVDHPKDLISPGNYEEVARDSHELEPWLQECRDRYRRELSSDYQNPQARLLRPLSFSLPRSWMLLAQLTGLPNAKFTRTLSHFLRNSNFSASIRFGHTTRSDKYPEICVPHPLLWFLLKHGTIQIGDSIVRLAALFDRRCESAVAQVMNREQFSLTELENALPHVTACHDEICTMWLAIIKKFVTPQALGNDSLRELWASAARDRVVPESLLTQTGEIPLVQVFVTGSADLAQRARTSERIVLVLDEQTLELWISHGARNLSELMMPKWAEQTGPAASLVSVVPELADVLQDEVKESARCQPVSDLKLAIDEASNPVPCLMWENTLLLDLTQLASLTRATRIKCLVDEVVAAGWLKGEPGDVLRILGDGQVDALRAQVAQCATLAERLLRAVGNRVDPLKQALGDLAEMEFIQTCSPSQLAELTLAQLGPATLSLIKDTLAAEGLNPPSRWNTAEARAFVTSIGFPEEFAASSEARREPEEFISGPIELPELHDFQKEVFEGIRQLITSGSTRRRAVVSLPTGGGKTRVTVESAVRLVLAPEGARRSVVWVAQTDELCEQAVQAFRQVWINLGAQATELRIVRLWAGNPNPAIQAMDRPLVVVASIQTLNNRIKTDELAWLQKPGLVVVDECHHAITPSYSNLLRWLDAEAPRPGAVSRDEPPIIGLSATPFRTDDEESLRLARRFDNLWFPPNQDQLHTRLRSQGVLAGTDYEPLQSGVGLLDEEIEQLGRLPEHWEGLDFENILEAINQRLGGDTQRSQRLIERIQRSDERAILFFANSVHHAEEMSARLNLAGVSAAAVSGNTSSMARRYFIERFQRGDIRVLCNHSVLTTGFDAPKTDMVFIARQVFSPVRYMQMVGRGLRGEKNGGTAYCRVVTVIDNLGRFQDRHPYHYCQKYFSDSSDEYLTSR